MSLLHRWSLPSRSFTRDKPQDGEPSSRSKFPTIHIGQLGPHRRANLSTVFSSLFEEPENHSSRRNEDRSEAADDLLLLVPRRENVPPDTGFKYSHIHERRGATPVGAALAQQSSTLELVSKNAEVGDTEPPSYLMPGIFGRTTQQIEEAPKVRSFSLSSTETCETEDLDEPPPLTPAKRILSGSSCYPSEGMRSPSSGHCSPEPVTTRTMNYVAEYRRFSQNPYQNPWHLSSICTTEALSSNAVRGKAQIALTSSGIAPGRVAATQNNNLESSPFADPPDDRTELTFPYGTQPQHGSTVPHAIDPQQQPSSTSEITVPILENEHAVSSQLEVSFMSYRQANVRSTSDDGNGCRLEGRNAGSTDRLRPSADTDRTTLTAVRRPSESDGEGARSTIRGTGERPLSRAASWMQLFTLTAANDSSNTLAQRLQKLKLRKWAKRVYFKTKARVELMGSPVPTAKPANAGVRRRNWRLKMKKNAAKRLKKVRKGLGKSVEKNKSRKYWSLGRTLEITKMRVMQHRETANHFFGALAKRKSVQFGLLTSEKNDEVLGTHQRVQSCPAEMGL
ncbi:hypothetical protein EKO27_g11212 [Xylaria grammica]|uniref:Uncharacterized protein n=1 Tax=Xylaria grammica TaxID=363999 RepID=A0A439CP15_9PEZI|nr:hypothetical protein EKO27_g11212 [Xylaria grammica]